MAIYGTAPIRFDGLGRIEAAVGGTPKGRAALAMIGLMRDAMLRGAAIPELRWSQLHPLPDGGARLDLPRRGPPVTAPLLQAIARNATVFGFGRIGADKDGSRYAGPSTMEWLAPLRGLPDAPVFAGRGGAALSAAAAGGRIRAAAGAAGLEGSFGTASPLAGMEIDLFAAGLARNRHGVRQLHLSRPPAVSTCRTPGCFGFPEGAGVLCDPCRDLILSGPEGAGEAARVWNRHAEDAE